MWYLKTTQRYSSPENENSLTHLPTTMPMEGWMKCLTQSTSGVSGVKFVEAESNTIEVNGDLEFRCNKTTEKAQHA